MLSHKLKFKRYTLPYREETIMIVLPTLILMIHPPVQGGNLFVRFSVYMPFDTPSHTGRKRDDLSYINLAVRYTLPYREETQIWNTLGLSHPIHPPIQGGNSCLIHCQTGCCDTPSHTGRKLASKTCPRTLLMIHPPIQGGNPAC